MPTSALGQTDQIRHGKQRILIDYSDDFNNSERKLIYYWLESVSKALMTVYGSWPNDTFHITIKRSKNRTSPVPWGQVKRGHPANVLLVINPDFGYAKLINDWTAFHELSHLLLPYRGYGNVWLSEGLATYYQNIVQARSGLFDETRMWQKLVTGFERGARQQSWNQLNLTELSDNLRENHQYMRVHWSGVLYWLSADVTLRKHGKGTLDSALKRLSDCCASQAMSAEDIVHKLDELLHTRLFVPLFNKYCATYSLPDYKPILTELGVRSEPGANHIVFSDDAPQAYIRKAIYNPFPDN